MQQYTLKKHTANTAQKQPMPDLGDGLAEGDARLARHGRHVVLAQNALKGDKGGGDSEHIVSWVSFLGLQKKTPKNTQQKSKQKRKKPRKKTTGKKPPPQHTKNPPPPP